MPEVTAVTHVDLAPGRRNTDLGSKTGSSLAILTILCGLMSFVLCLFAEVTRSKVRTHDNAKDYISVVEKFVR